MRGNDNNIFHRLTWLYCRALLKSSKDLYTIIKDLLCGQNGKEKAIKRLKQEKLLGF